MSVELKVPSPIFQIYAICKDDSLPNFVPDNWIKENRWYKVKWFADALNVDDVAVTITDKENNEIHPSPSICAFRVSRFEFQQICLN